MKDVKMIVAAHKQYWMPEDPMYFPIHVGSAGKMSIGYTRDDSGDNISEKNPNFCELTGIYWAWKNLSADYVGLVHYRRYFTEKHFGKNRNKRILSSEELEKLLNTCDVILPKQRNYFIETNYSQYVHAHHEEDLQLTRQILGEKYPEYLPAYDASMKITKGHRFNMFIMKRDAFDEYCTWLFDVLFTLEKRLDISDYSSYDARVFGFVSERLIDVWVNTRQIPYKELAVWNLESQNWPKKIYNFICRKVKGANK